MQCGGKENLQHKCKVSAMRVNANVKCQLEMVGHYAVEDETGLERKDVGEWHRIQKI